MNEREAIDEREPIAARDAEYAALIDLDRALRSDAGSAPALVLPDGAQVALPETVARILRRAVHELARDRAVQLLTLGRDLTTQQAADLLNVSRPYLIQLLDSGQIPHHMVGSHRRVPLDALLVFRRQMHAAQDEALDEMVRISEEAGMYDLPAKAGGVRRH